MSSHALPTLRVASDSLAGDSSRLLEDGWKTCGFVGHPIQGHFYALAAHSAHQSCSPDTTTRPPVAPVRPKIETWCARAGQLTPAIDQVQKDAKARCKHRGCPLVREHPAHQGRALR